MKEQPAVDVLISSLSDIFEPDSDLNASLERLIKAVYTLTGCEYVFLSRYDPAGKMFRPVIWHGSITPGTVALDQKFMGGGYFSNKPIIINKLTQFNYRLQPAVARMGLMSMAGIPLIGRQGLLGLLEVFSHQPDKFAEETVDLLMLLGKYAVLLLEKADYIRECRLWSVENGFLHDAQTLEQSSAGLLLYKLGENLASLLDADGIAIFGLDQHTEYDVLQEVLVKGFSMQDIKILKKGINKEVLEKLTARSGDGVESLIFKQTLSSSGAPDEKLIYIVPVLGRQNLYGVIVFYWQQLHSSTDMMDLERFAKRVINHVARLLDRQYIYNDIQRISFTDTLTDLANRRLFDYVLNREIEKVKRNGSSLSLLMIDIDYFKLINDTYGHVVGDTILEQVGSLLKGHFRRVDLTARYGGEKFAVILPDTDQDNGLIVAERFRSELEFSKFLAGNRYIHLTASIGTATYSGKPGFTFSSPEAFIQAADHGLSLAKRLGRNKVAASGDGETL